MGIYLKVVKEVRVIKVEVIWYYFVMVDDYFLYYCGKIIEIDWELLFLNWFCNCRYSWIMLNILVRSLIGEYDKWSRRWYDI